MNQLVSTRAISRLVRYTRGIKKEVIKMRPENQRMTEFLKSHGIKARVKYIHKGSVKHTWRLHDAEQTWGDTLIEKLTALGFSDFDGRPLNKYSGNGGHFSIFVRGHYELLEDND